MKGPFFLKAGNPNEMQNYEFLLQEENAGHKYFEMFSWQKK